MVCEGSKASPVSARLSGRHEQQRQHNSPQDISSGMLRRPPANLNKQSQDATILLIREVLQRGITLTEVTPQLQCLALLTD